MSGRDAVDSTKLRYSYDLHRALVTGRQYARGAVAAAAHELDRLGAMPCHWRASPRGERGQVRVGRQLEHGRRHVGVAGVLVIHLELALGREVLTRIPDGVTSWIWRSGPCLVDREGPGQLADWLPLAIAGCTCPWPGRPG